MYHVVRVAGAASLVAGLMCSMAFADSTTTLGQSATATAVAGVGNGSGGGCNCSASAKAVNAVGSSTSQTGSGNYSDTRIFQDADALAIAGSYNGKKYRHKKDNSTAVAKAINRALASTTQYGGNNHSKIKVRQTAEASANADSFNDY